MVALKRAPSTTTDFSVMAEMMKATSTPRMVSECVTLRPMWLPPNFVPNRPATAAPTRGASGTASRVDAERVALILLSTLERVEFVYVDARLVAEQQDQQREADGRFGRRHRQDEEHEDLAVHVAQVVRESHEVHVDREQHQL